LGIQATTPAILLNHRYGMSKRKVCQLFSQYFGLPLTIGGVVQLQDRLATGLEADYAALVEQARQSAVLYSDETSWYRGQPQGWLWTFTNAALTLYQVAESRSRAVIEQVIGPAYAGVLVSDGLSGYDNLCAHQHKCYAHQLKAIRQALQLEADNQYLKAWQALLKKAIVHKQQQANLSQQAHEQECIQLALQAVHLLERPRASPMEQKIGNRLQKQADHLFTFLRYQPVEATNKRAERSLRPAVIHRKISCGNKTRKGADTGQVLASVLVTAQQNHIDFTQKVRAVIKQHL
jgi:hypothetical protein